MPKDRFVGVLPPLGAPIVHVRADAKNPPHAIDRSMGSIPQHGCEFRELLEVALLLQRKEAEPLEERYDSVRDLFEIVHLEVPHAIATHPHAPASKLALEHAKDLLVSLRDVETKGDLPRNRAVIAPLPERHVEASFPVGEAGQVEAQVGRYTLDVGSQNLRVFPADCPHLRIVTARRCLASSGGYSEFPAYG